MTYHAKVINGGKIVIPADLRREMGIHVGDSLVVDRNSMGHLVIKTYQQVVTEVQTEFRRLRAPDAVETSVVDELLAERKAEMIRESAGLARWNDEQR